MISRSRGILKYSNWLLFSIFLFYNCSGSGPDKSMPHAYTISVENMKFNPDMIKVHKGDSVIWINHDMVAHCVTAAGQNAWTSGAVPPGKSWKMAVTKSSDYYCAIHPVMKGKIVVE